ncbi:PTS transporter subunit EIIC [Spiroplasma sp. SV19]|uniref:PTS transporter subunit EIIC n=1 Tax=Spiroplasma sp. SV19 TaxID=2570468 RepID=UPI0024B861D8|nr:PTS transporter subunit EIIC [Spiroplasma sp. SV19]WHQ36574.1 hypothetical protein E7Y35_01345 [Spiroplasma sp. SV19]
MIIGTGLVDKFYKVYKLNETNISDPFDNKVKEKLWRKELNFKTNIFMVTKKGLNSFSTIFVPLIPVFIAGGMSLALMSLVKSITPTSGFIKLFDVIGGAILGSIPVFVGYTTAKKMGANPFLGVAMGLILISPGLLNRYATNTPILLEFNINADQEIIDKAIHKAWLNYLLEMGIDPLNPPTNIIIPKENEIVGIYYTIFTGFFKIKLVGYQAQIVPILLVLLLSCSLEKLMRKFVPDVIGIIIVPLGTVIISTWLAFWVIGPLGEIIGRGLSIGLQAIFKYTNWNMIGFGGALFAGIYPFLVVTGLHQGFLPIETQLIVDSQLHYGHTFTFITPIACVSNIAQGTAALMFIFFTKEKKEKSQGLSGVIGAYTGITEPAMFGINLQVKPLFISAAIGAMVGGWWLGMSHTVANSLGSASWIGLVQFDWTTTHTRQFFEQNNINSILQNVPMGGHAIIAMSISTIVTAGTAFGLLKTKWGKESLKQHLKNK